MGHTPPDAPRTAAIAAWLVVAFAGSAIAKPLPGHPGEYPRRLPILTAVYDTAIGPAVGVGLLTGKHTVCTQTTRGWLLQAQVGRDGAKARLGIGGAQSQIIPFFGLAAAATFIRTWADGSNLPPDQSYLGVELTATLFHARITTGVVQRVSGTRGAPRRVVASVGLGF